MKDNNNDYLKRLYPFWDKLSSRLEIRISFISLSRTEVIMSKCQQNKIRTNQKLKENKVTSIKTEINYVVCGQNSVSNIPNYNHISYVTYDRKLGFKMKVYSEN